MTTNNELEIDFVKQEKSKVQINIYSAIKLSSVKLILYSELSGEKYKIDDIYYKLHGFINKQYLYVLEVDFICMKQISDRYEEEYKIKFIYKDCNNNVFCASLKKRKIIDYSIKQISNVIYNKKDNYSDEIFTYSNKNRTMIGMLFFNTENILKFTVTEREYRYINQFVNKAINVRIKGNNLYLKAKCYQIDGKWIGFILQYRSKNEDELIQYFFPASEVKKVGEYYVMKTRIKLSGLLLKLIYWDIMAVFERDKIKYLSLIKNNSILYKIKYLSLIRKNYFINREDNILFYPYVYKNEFVGLQGREKKWYDCYKFFIKERFALLLWIILYPIWNMKNICLVYEKFCVMAQDNAYYFFKFCMDNDMERKMDKKIYYIIDKYSPDWEKMQEYKDNIIEFGSLKHIIYVLAAKLLISTDTKMHSYPWRPMKSIVSCFIRRKKLVFLQHGVIGFKKIESIYSKENPGGCDMFITSSECEKKIVIENFKYNDSEVVVTGLARWDVLKDCSKDKKEILIMPTWRTWMDEIEEELFINSIYYKNYMKLLNSPTLMDFMDKYDIRIVFYLHPKFRGYIGDFSVNHNRITLIPFGQESLNNLIMRCKLLVTDYSSVAWDVFYQAKPVIFYQFDLEMYNKIQGSYMDMDKELFGDKVYETDELIELFEYYANNEFKIKDKYLNMQKDYYGYIDHNNSMRICKEIMHAKI